VIPIGSSVQLSVSDQALRYFPDDAELAVAGVLNFELSA